MLRVALGLVVIYMGLARLDGTGGCLHAIAGLLPVAMGLGGPCLVHLAMQRLRRA